MSTTTQDIDAFDAQATFAWLCRQLANGYISPEDFRITAQSLKIPAADIKSRITEAGQ